MLPTARGVKVLLIEDNPGDARLVREALRLGGANTFSVVVAARLSEALERLDSEPFDVALVDLSLPDSQGIETFKKVREHARSVPILILTGLDDELVATSAVGEGAQDYVLKRNLATDVLPRAILYALSRQQLMQQLENQLRELQESEERYRVVTQAAMDAIVTVDSDDRVLFLNRAAEALFGYTVGELFGKPAAALLPPERGSAGHSPVLLSPVEAATRAGGEPMAVTGFNRAGERLPLELTAGAMELGGRKVYTAVLRDVSARRRAEEMRARLAAIVDSSEDAIVGADAGALIHSWNPGAQALFGYSEAEAGGLHLGDLFDPAARPAVAAALAGIVEGGPGSRLELAGRRRDGRSVGVSVTLSALRDGLGHVAGFSAIARDITERRAAEAALRRSEERFRALTERSADAISIVDRQARVTYVSHSITAMTGFQPEEILGKPGYALIHPEDRDGAQEKMGWLLANPGKYVAITQRLLHKDGHWFWSEGVMCNLLHDPAVGGVVSNFRDISARKRAEEAVLRSEERFRKLTEQSSDVISVLGVDRRFTYTSPSVRTVLGYEPEEVVGHSPSDFIHPEDAEDFARARAELVRRPGQPLPFQFRVRHKDGTWRWIEAVATNLLDDPTVGGILSNWRDITDRFAALEALQESELRYRLVARASMEALWDWNLVNNRVEWTEGFQSLFGAQGASAQAARSSFYTLIHPDDRDRVADSIRAVLKGQGSSWSGDYRVARADGTYASASARGFVVRDASGKPLRLIGALSDVTERQALQEFRESLLDVISHEFRTPVTIIQGYAEMLSTGKWKTNSDSWARARDRIERASRHLTFLLGSITELSHLRAGGVQARLVACDTRSAIRNAVASMNARRGGPGRLVKVEVAPGAEAVMADERKLEICLVELIDNAVKFSPADAPIALHASLADGRVALDVVDEGAGMDAKARAHLFKPFSQADMSSVRKAGGAGVGLAVVGGLVRAQGGEVSIRSAPGKGTTVRVLLPVPKGAP